ncbi:MAG: beta-galactosidase [Verrucomicrobiales bacterium]
MNLRKTIAALVASCFAHGICAADDAEVKPGQTEPGWGRYETIMWISDSAYKKPEKTAVFFERLKEMGITTGMVHGDGDLTPLLQNKFPYYVENVVNRGLCLKFNSKVKDWDKFVTDWSKNGRPDEALIRDYALDDPKWLDYATKQMRDLVKKNKGNKPLAYDIRDELSITISANPFDYDFNPITLASFRKWLQAEYSTLKALNEEWETQFSSWEEVKPFTTDQIKNRMASGAAMPRGKPDWHAVQQIKFNPAAARTNSMHWNFSPWADFRTYMDSTLVNALSEIRKAGRAEDPSALIGIEGTQMPSAFGGYDLERMSTALDWVEPYDIGNARDIFGSFMRGKPIVATVFENETNPASRRLWHLLLEGDRGCIIWWSEDCIDWNSPDYQLTEKGKALAPVLKELRSPLASIFLQAKKEVDPIYIHYSQPSIQVDWLLESTVDGSTWLRRFSSYEADHNRMAKVRNSWLKLFQDAGYSPQFLSSADLKAGNFSDGPGVLVLPQSYAMSEEEMKQTLNFASGGNGKDRTVLADGAPGMFDQHGKLRISSPLDVVFPPALSEEKVYFLTGSVTNRSADSVPIDIASYGAKRLEGSPSSLQKLAESVPMRPPVGYSFGNKTRVHRYQLGTARLLAFERNISYQMSEDLKQSGGNEPLEKPVDEVAVLSDASHVYDLRTGNYFGKIRQIRFTLNPWKPALFALLPEPLPEGGNLIDYLNQARE